MKFELVNNGKFTNEQVVILPISTTNLAEAIKLIPELQSALACQRFNAKKGETIHFNSLANFKSVILVGLGEKEDYYFNNYNAMEIGGKASKYLTKYDSEVAVILNHISNLELVKALALGMASGIKLKAYKFNKYLNNTPTKLNDISKLATVKVITNNIDVTRELNYATTLTEGIYLTRNLVIEPANIIYPATFVERLEELKALGVEIEVLHKKDLEELKMGSLLSVNQGSFNEPLVAILKYNGTNDNSAPLAFVGKGVTFDSGGLSLKSPGAMIGMKSDMAGAATVAGTIKTLALRKAKVNAIGVMGLVENLVNSKATKPGDVITSYSGKTIEVLNTDAEGRLVLADLLTYTQEKYKPKFMIDLATLTGAIIITLGHFRAGLFSNNQNLAQQLIESGESSGDKLWQLPVTEEYRSLMDSNIADISNLGKADRAAGSVTAAIFLKEFIGDAIWAHIDIAGVAWRGEETDISGSGANGFGVRLLDTLVAKYYEQN